MDSQSLEKASALDELYGRITEVAGEMSGFSVRVLAPASFPTAMVDAPRRENTPALHVSLPDDFRVEFAPSYPLNIGNTLSVRAVRTHREGRKTDWTFNHLQGVWQYAQKPITDDDIRKCLTPEGPRPAVY